VTGFVKRAYLSCLENDRERFAADRDLIRFGKASHDEIAVGEIISGNCSKTWEVF
jgi:hypothetical protein